MHSSVPACNANKCKSPSTKNSAFRSIGFALLVGVGLVSCQKNYSDKVTPPPTPVDQDSTKPNVIMFLADDVGYEVPHFTGGESYSTPNLDFMAANGMQFTYFFSHPDGYPSRLALLTGKYNFRNYIRWGYLPPDQQTIGNMLEDAGYATCYVGKWQSNGGDFSIRSHGFQKYSVYVPFSSDSQREGRYKSPKIYENSAYLDKKQTKNRYSEDIFSDYLCNFIDSVKGQPFFGIYSLNLCAAPYVPSPDDPAYAAWNPKGEIKKDDPKYFKSMVEYMDKMIGKVIANVRAHGLERNTVFMFCADNSTQKDITSQWKGMAWPGAKTTTDWRGTLQPFVVYWLGKVNPGQVSSTLGDYTDFMPTLADIAHIPRPTTYGTLDGVSLYDNLLGIAGTDRDWTFTRWNNDDRDDALVPAEIYVQNHEYKLYDTPHVRFYDLVADRDEKNDLSGSVLTPEQQAIRTEFEAVLAEMH